MCVVFTHVGLGSCYGGGLQVLLHDGRDVKVGQVDVTCSVGQQRVKQIPLTVPEPLLVLRH